MFFSDRQDLLLVVSDLLLRALLEDFLHLEHRLVLGGEDRQLPIDLGGGHGQHVGQFAPDYARVGWRCDGSRIRPASNAKAVTERARAEQGLAASKNPSV